jgi:hypothetical protein
LILGSTALPALVLGGTAQPTALGFLVVGTGLMLAACNPTREMLSQREYDHHFPEPQHSHV